MSTIQDNTSDRELDEKTLLRKYVFDTEFRDRTRRLAKAGDKFWLDFLNKHSRTRIYSAAELREVNRRLETEDVDLSSSTLIREDIDADR